MIKKITLENFKLFKEKTTFPLSNLNLFTGVNGGGKSTVLQALLLWRQSIDIDGGEGQIYLNGDCIKMGSFDDLRNSNTPIATPIKVGFYGENECGIEYVLSDMETDERILGVTEYTVFDEEKIEYSYKEMNYNIYFNEKEDKPAGIRNLLPEYEFTGEKTYHDLSSKNENDGTTTIEWFRVDNINFNFEKIHYIAADRIGPQNYFEKGSLGNFVNVGARGENTANVLHRKEDYLVNDKLYLGNDAQTLMQQTEEWLGKVFGGAKVELKGKERDHSVLNVLLNTNQTEKRYKPVNVGFGYSYILPIIVSGLIAEEGDMLIVENPEAHLHPKAQAELTRFLALVASCGVQVFIESHSEHILNSIRIAVLQEEIALKNKDASVLFFSGNTNDKFVALPIEEDGKINNWPDGFFDQQEIDLSEIFNLARQQQ